MIKGRDHDQNTYVHGTYNAICDVCGFKKKAIDMLSRWDGLFVCKDDWEPRHVLDFGRSVQEKNGVDIPRPDPIPKFKDIPYIQDPEAEVEDPVWTTVYLNEITAEYDGGPVYGVTVITDTYAMHQNYGGGIYSVYRATGLPGEVRITLTVLEASRDDLRMYLNLENTPSPALDYASLEDNDAVMTVAEDTIFNIEALPEYAPADAAVTMETTNVPLMVMGLIPSMVGVLGEPDSIVAQLKVEILT